MARRRESGFAMLLVFLLAAVIAISLYMEMPRAVFESQRNREQLLIDRGEQYKRAIQVFYRRYNRYPPTLEALDGTDNRHFLRQHYKDPMTGQDEWRLVHAGPGGIFLDSLVNKPPAVDQKSDTSTASTAAPADAAAPSPWTRQRPSDVTLSATQFQGGVAPPGQVLQPDLMPTDVAVNPDNPQPVPVTMTPPPSPGQTIYPPGQPMAVPGLQPGVPGQPTMQQPPGIVAGQISSPQPGATVAPVGQNPAIDMIRQMLTRPNPQGLSGVPSAAGAQPSAGGIAGVASKLEAEGIKVYHDRTKYNEWEFLYDPRLDRTAVRAGAPQMPGSVPAAPGSSVPGVPVPAHP